MRSLLVACVLVSFAACARPSQVSGAVSCPGGVACAVADLAVGDDAGSGGDGDLAQPQSPADLSTAASSDLAQSIVVDLAMPTAADLAMASSCAHPICATGVKLVSSCDPCATKVCTKDSYCCATSWNSICVGEVGSVCGQTCP